MVLLVRGTIRVLIVGGTGRLVHTFVAHIGTHCGHWTIQIPAPLAGINTISIMYRVVNSGYSEIEC